MAEKNQNFKVKQGLTVSGSVLTTSGERIGMGTNPVAPNTLTISGSTHNSGDIKLNKALFIKEGAGPSFGKGIAFESGSEDSAGFLSYWNDTLSFTSGSTTPFALDSKNAKLVIGDSISKVSDATLTVIGRISSSDNIILSKDKEVCFNSET